MSDIVRLILIVILLVMGVSAYFLVIHAFFGARIAQTKSIAKSMPGRSFGIGLVNFLFFSVIAMILLSVAENAGPFIKVILTVPGVITLAFLTILLSVGLAGMSELIGERLFPELPAWKQIVWGTVCLSLACGLPFAGWFLLLPYAGFIGIGSVILGSLRKEKMS